MVTGMNRRTTMSKKETIQQEKNEENTSIFSGKHDKIWAENVIRDHAEKIAIAIVKTPPDMKREIWVHNGKMTIGEPIALSSWTASPYIMGHVVGMSPYATEGYTRCQKCGHDVWESEKNQHTCGDAKQAIATWNSLIDCIENCIIDSPSEWVIIYGRD